MSWLAVAVGILIATIAGLGTAWIVLVATVFWLGYRDGFDWPVVGPALLIGGGSALLGISIFSLGRRLRP